MPDHVQVDLSGVKYVEFTTYAGNQGIACRHDYHESFRVHFKGYTSPNGFGIPLPEELLGSIIDPEVRGLFGKEFEWTND